MYQWIKFLVPCFALFSSACLENCDSPLSPSSPSSRNNQIWIAPNVGSRDYLDMFKRPEEWTEARSKTGVFQFYHQNVSFGSCSTCGNNNFQTFVNVVPGGAFKWLNDKGIKISIEAGAVKPWHCGSSPDDSVAGTVKAISDIQSTGARVSFISIDEPFSGASQCAFGPRDFMETVRWTKYYIDNIRRVYPNIQVGLIEAYPAWSIAEIEKAISGLNDLGVRIPFFHLDMHRRGGLAWKDISGDLRELSSFLRERGIVFGIIIWGDDGSSNENFSGDALNTTSLVRSAIGTPDHIIVQSWSEDPSVFPKESKIYPDNIPEDKVATLTWLLLQVGKYFGIN